jgi:p-hydroxybenzoate 3-monooxygenase
MRSRAAVRLSDGGGRNEIDCDIIAGCDSFHGVCRRIPNIRPRISGCGYPLDWFGILAEAPPSTEDNVYASHEHDFALLAMCSPTLSRLYLLCAPDEDLAAWSDGPIWAELQTRAARVGFRLAAGPILRRASRRYGVARWNRCSAGDCVLPAMPRTSFSRLARRD